MSPDPNRTPMSPKTTPSPTRSDPSSTKNSWKAPSGGLPLWLIIIVAALWVVEQSGIFGFRQTPPCSRQQPTNLGELVDDLIQRLAKRFGFSDVGWVDRLGARTRRLTHSPSPATATATRPPRPSKTPPDHIRRHH
jgi:hypothetical protein